MLSDSGTGTSAIHPAKQKAREVVGSKESKDVFQNMKKLELYIRQQEPGIWLTKANLLLLLRRRLELFGLLPQLFFYLGKRGV